MGALPCWKLTEQKNGALKQRIRKRSHLPIVYVYGAISHDNYNFKSYLVSGGSTQKHTETKNAKPNLAHAYVKQSKLIMLFAGTDFPASVRDNPCKSSGSNGIAQQESPLLTWKTKNQTDFWDKIGLQYFAIWCYDTVFPSPLQNSEKRGNFVHQLHRHIRDRRQYQSLSTSRLFMWIAIVWWKQKVWE